MRHSYQCQLSVPRLVVLAGIQPRLPEPMILILFDSAKSRQNIRAQIPRGYRGQLSQDAL